jgi:hypothetical protein
MRSSGWAALIVVVAWAAAAGADPAASAADAAQISARKLRHQWDQFRSSEPVTATCLEDKVARALTIANRIERRRAELREATDDKARALALGAIGKLDEQRVELENEALLCTHGKTFALLATGTHVTLRVNPGLPHETAERELMLLLTSMPMLGK